MIKKIKDYIFNNKKAPQEKNTARLNIWDKLSAYRNLPKFFMLVWRTNPLLTFTNCILRILQAFLPLVILRIGKVIIDQVVQITHNKDTSQTHLWKFVVIEFFLVVSITFLSRAISLLDDLLGELLTNHTNVMIMTHAATLDLNQFEDSVFYDKLERARQQSAARALLLSQLFGQVQDLITVISYVVILIAFNPWLILMLAIFFLPSMFASAYFNAKNYLLIRSQTEGRRELDYLNLVGSSDATAKEVRLFDLSAFFIKRYRKMSINLYKAKRK